MSGDATFRRMAISGGKAAAPDVRRLMLLVAGTLILSYVDRGLLPIAAPLVLDDLGLSATAFGIAIAAFFWVYAPVHFVAGWMVDRYDVYRLYGAGIGIWGLATALTAAASGLTALVGSRLLMGLGQSFLFPGSSRIIVRHAGEHLRGRMNAVVIASIAIGQALAASLGGLALAAFGWRGAFVAFGLMTIAWLVPWHRATRHLHAIMTDAGEDGIAYPVILRCRALWATTAGHFCTNYVLYFVIAWLPLFLVRERGLPLETMALLTTLTFAGQAGGALGAGALGDLLVSRGGNPRVVYKSLIVGCVLVSGLFVLAVAGASDAWLPLVLIGTGTAIGGGGALVYVIAQRLAGPRAAGRWVGVQNGAANVAGIVGPILTGILVDTSGNYQAALLLAALVALAGGLLWGLAVPRVEPLHWHAR